jgi:hypothetical protein
MLISKNVAKECDSIILSMEESLKRQNDLSSKLPNSSLKWGYETATPANQRKSLSQTKACDIKKKLGELNKDLSGEKKYNTEGGIKVLRDRIAPHMRREALQNLTEEDHPDLFKAATMIRRAEKGDFDFIGKNVGVFAKPKEPVTSRLGRALDPNIVPNWTVHVPPPASSDEDDSDGPGTDESPPMIAEIDPDTLIIRKALELRDADAEENLNDSYDSGDSDADHSRKREMDDESLSASLNVADDDNVGDCN